MIEQMKLLINKYIGDDAPAITGATALGSDLGLNSLELVQMVCDVEDEFGVEIPDRAISSFKTIQDVIDYVSA